eukprot:COSAG01_NODE_7452_length_3206_cov_3.162858_3_plen_122_part_00
MPAAAVRHETPAAAMKARGCDAVPAARKYPVCGATQITSDSQLRRPQAASRHRYSGTRSSPLYVGERSAGAASGVRLLAHGIDAPVSSHDLTFSESSLRQACVMLTVEGAVSNPTVGGGGQ